MLVSDQIHRQRIFREIEKVNPKFEEMQHDFISMGLNYLNFKAYQTKLLVRVFLIARSKPYFLQFKLLWYLYLIELFKLKNKRTNTLSRKQLAKLEKLNE